MEPHQPDPHPAAIWSAVIFLLLLLLIGLYFYGAQTARENTVILDSEPLDTNNTEVIDFSSDSDESEISEDQQIYPEFDLSNDIYTPSETDSETSEMQ